MSLYIIHVGRLQACIGERLTNHSLLCRPIGHGQATARSILIHSSTPDQCEDRVMTCQSVAQAFEYQQSRSLATAITIG